MKPVFTNWSDTYRQKFDKSPFVTEHSLHERRMFTDAGIADLLDRYPREHVLIYTMNDDPSNEGRIFRRGDPGDLTGAEIVEAIHRGRLWLNLRAMNDYLPDCKALCEEMFGELEARVPGLKTLKHDCGLLISSPKARVFYHLDIPCVMLWQMRGTKTVHIYPKGTPYIRNDQIEAIVLRLTEEEIDYDPAFEADRTSYTLTPGMVASWPQTAPHRVENGDCINVSLSCEFQTFSSLIYANALYTNAMLRRRFGFDPDIHKDGAARLYAKAAMARLLKVRRRNNMKREKISPASFTVDLSEESGIRDIPVA